MTEQPEQGRCECYLCGNWVAKSSSDIEHAQFDLLYHGGNGKTRTYCMKCVVDAISLTKPKRSVATSSVERGGEPTPASVWLEQNAYPELEEIFAKFVDGPITRSNLAQLLAPLFERYAAVRREQPTPSALEMLEQLQRDWRSQGYDASMYAKELQPVLDRLRREDGAK